MVLLSTSGDNHLAGAAPGPVKMVLAGLLFVVLLCGILLQSKLQARNSMTD